MTDADVFGKLSRIFETHAFGKEKADYELDDILEELDPVAEPQSGFYGRSLSPTGRGRGRR